MLILHVDDDSDDREIFCEALKAVDSQISFIEVESGLKALEFLAKTEILPDYIFIDINMSKMNGYELVKEIISIPRMKGIQLVMHSTSFNPKDKDQFAKLGIKFLGKKNRFSELVESLKSVVFSHVTVLGGKSEM